ncbi:T9SS type A sorting domain-containing protein, partial [Balneolaceae bacterium ANBcel3]|nr:T9SS type A sorting domain-containing protein [Balneolaceae bacterium ANBcel3]
KPLSSYAIDWQDENLFVPLNPNEVTLGAVLDRDHGLKIYDSYLYMVRMITEDGVDREALLRYNLETKHIYEFRHELLPGTIRYDVGVNKLVVPVSSPSSWSERFTGILIYDLENHRYVVFKSLERQIARGFMILSDNTLITSEPPYDCCEYIVTRRELETLETILRSQVGYEYFSHGSRFREYGNNPYFSRVYYHPVLGNYYYITHFTSSNTLGGGLELKLKSSFNDFSITDEYRIVGGGLIEVELGMYYDGVDYMGKLAAFSKTDRDDILVILPDVPGEVLTMKMVDDELYFMGTFSELGDSSTAGGIASYHFETGEYRTFNSGVNGFVNTAEVTDGWFIIGGDFSIDNDAETIHDLAYWDDDDEQWRAFEVDYSEPEQSEPEENETPSAIALHQNYPNPFNPATQISYDLPEPASVSLTIYTINGQPVRTYDEGFKESGRHEITFDGSGLASGVYLYRISIDGKIITRKMMLLN